MLVGLPLSGKSTWAAAYMSEHPEKKYTILSTANILKWMKAELLPNHHEQEQRTRLLGIAKIIFNQMLATANAEQRHYILDQ